MRLRTEQRLTEVLTNRGMADRIAEASANRGSGRKHGTRITPGSRDADYADHARLTGRGLRRSRRAHGTRITRIMPTSREDLRLATGRAAGAGATGDHQDQHGPIARGGRADPGGRPPRQPGNARLAVVIRDAATGDQIRAALGYT